MDKFLKVVGIGCGGCLVLIVAAAVVAYVMLPSEMHVERSKMINAPVEVVFPLVDTPSRWPEWDPWARLDPDMTYVYEGPPAGVGAISRWESDDPNVGSGWFEIKESVPGQYIVFDLHMVEMDSDAIIRFEFEEVGDGTKVVWIDDAELDGFGMRLFGLVADAVLGAQFDQGLTELKRIAEREYAELKGEGEAAGEALEAVGDEAMEAAEEAAEAVGGQ